MERIMGAGAVDVLPAAEEGASEPGFFTKGNPTTATPATKLTADWCNGIQEELMAVIEGAGLTADPDDLTQLFQAIQQLIEDAAPTITHDRIYISGLVAGDFAAGVADGSFVYLDNGTGDWTKAQANGGGTGPKVRGVADVTNGEVTLWGKHTAGITGLSAGSVYWLDAATAGTITATAPSEAVKVGYAKSATEFWVDVDSDAGNNLKKDVEDQVISGGATVTSKSITAGSFTVDPGDRPLQYQTNNGAETITAPAADGYTVIKVTNGASAGALSFSGFSVGSNTGDALTTTNGHIFFIFILRINGTSTYQIKAAQ